MKSKQKPSGKIHRRYLLIEGAGKEEIEKVILDYIGILGWAKAAPFFVKSEKGTVLAVERGELESVRAAFEMAKGNVRVIRVSGTIKGLGN